MPLVDGHGTRARCASKRFAAGYFATPLTACRCESEPAASWEQSLQQWAEKALAGGRERLLEEASPIFERIMIEAALQKTAGRRREAAELLGWGRNTLTRKIKELGVQCEGDDDAP